MEGSSTKLEIKIDWSEIDALGHINNLAIMRYIQSCRVKYLESIDMLPVSDETGTGPVVAAISCQFMKPLFYPGKVTVYAKAGQLKNTSFRLDFKLMNNKGEQVAEAHDIIVYYDFRKNAKTIIPDEIKKKIMAG